MKSKFLLVILIIFTAITRFYMLGNVPSGIYPDEESHAYNAYSIINTGRDRYDQSNPVLFRSFGSYQPPVLTYLTTLPVFLFGNTIFSARFVNAVFAVFLVIITFYCVKALSRDEKKHKYAFISSFLVSISPWSIFFSRLTAEGYLGLTFFVLSLYLFIKSLKNIKYFSFATLILALSTHAYYSERIIAILFLPAFLILYRKYFINYYREVLIGLGLFVLIMFPHIKILNSGALTRRFDQVGYSGSFNLEEFLRHFIMYYSPRNLFFDTGASLGRITPEMGVLYSVLVLPFLLAIKKINLMFNEKYIKVLYLLILISPIPAAITGDEFYPLRALVTIWMITIIVSFGVSLLYDHFPKRVGYMISLIFIPYFLFSFYISYFVLFKYEKDNDYPGLINKLEIYPNKEFFIDNSRDYGIGLRIAYLLYANPEDIQSQLRSQMKSKYYSSEVSNNDIYKIGKITVKQFSWQDVCGNGKIFIGDPLTISEEQALMHELKYQFSIFGLSGDPKLIAYESKESNNCDTPGQK